MAVKNRKYNFEDLEVWQDSMHLCESVYALVKQLPKSEQYGIGDQLKRAAISVPLNIAEGKGRHYDKEFHKFLMIARGSLFEVVTILKLIPRLSLLNDPEVEVQIEKSHLIAIKLQMLAKNLRTS